MSSNFFSPALLFTRPNHQNRKEKDRRAERIKHWGNMKRFERMRRERQRNKNEARQMKRRERRRGLKYLHDGSSKPKAQIGKLDTN